MSARPNEITVRGVTFRHLWDDRDESVYDGAAGFMLYEIGGFYRVEFEYGSEEFARGYGESALEAFIECVDIMRRIYNHMDAALAEIDDGRA